MSLLQKIRLEHTRSLLKTARNYGRVYNLPRRILDAIDDAIDEIDQMLEAAGTREAA